MRSISHLILAGAIFSSLSWSNPVLASIPEKPLFSRDDILHLTLSAPFGNMSRKTDTPVPGTLTIRSEAPESLRVALSTRGITRLKREICAFPPLRVEFTEKPPPSSIFKAQKRLKLVTHCQTREDYQKYLLLEYAAYRIYRTLTPESFGVRLARIDYVAVDGHPLVSRLGFFIEDIDDVAQRNGQRRLKGVNQISISQLEPVAAARFALFQYMISNLDWSMTADVPGDDCCHNSRLIGMTGSLTTLIPVPYDFDSSGLVDAPYAVPPNSLRIANVRIRRYRGFCQHNTQAQKLVTELLARRAQVLAIIGEIPHLDQESRQKAASYLDGFFGQMSSEPQTSNVLKSCLQ